MDFPSIGNFQRECAGWENNAPTRADPLRDVLFTAGHADLHALEERLAGRSLFIGGPFLEAESRLRRGDGLHGLDGPIVPTGRNNRTDDDRCLRYLATGGENFQLQRAVFLRADHGAVGCTRHGCGGAGGDKIDGDEPEIEACVIAVAGQKPLVDGLPHGFGLKADTNRRFSVWRGCRLESSEDSIRIGHSLDVPPGGRVPNGNRFGVGNAKRSASEVHGDGATRVRIAHGKLALLQDECVVRRRVFEQRHGSLDTPDPTDDRADHENDDPEMGEKETGVIFFPRPAHERAAGEVRAEKKQPEVEPGRLVKPDARGVGVEFGFEDRAGDAHDDEHGEQNDGEAQ